MKLWDKWCLLLVVPCLLGASSFLHHRRGAFQPAGGAPSPVIENSSVTNYIPTGGEFTTNFIECSGVNRLLVTFIAFGDAFVDDDVHVTATYNGTAMSRAWETNDLNFMYGAMFYLVAPDTGGNYEVRLQEEGLGTPDIAFVSSFNITNADQSAPSSVTFDDFSAAVNTINVSSAADDLVVSGHTSDFSYATNWTGTTIGIVHHSKNDISAGTSWRAGSASTAMSWTNNSNGSVLGGFSVTAP